MKSPGKISLACLSIAVFVAAQSVPAYGLKSASKELVGQLTNGLSITPEQATGGAGLLFSIAKSRLSPEDFSKISAVVPGMNNFLKAAPSSPELTDLTDSLPGDWGSLVTATMGFQKLGLSPAMIEKFLPILLSFIEGKGGKDIAAILSKVMK
ncbi:MAG TPA: DUF2780 domain-containing protein [Terracidiphilus sp.]|nr:DUF2780 domain-containing protein [Terracidiphilus sp.]